MKKDIPSGVCKKYSSPTSGTTPFCKGEVAFNGYFEFFLQNICIYFFSAEQNHKFGDFSYYYLLLSLL